MPELATSFALALAWLSVNGLDALWIYFYVKTSVDPNPHTVLNRTRSAFTGYQVMMFLFGFFWAPVNVWVFWCYLKESFRSYPKIRLAHIFLVLPIALFFVIMPPFGGWIVLSIVQKWTWNHRCDGYPMYAILDGRGYKDPRFVLDVVHFYQTDTQQALFTYDVNDEFDSDLFVFQLREFDTDQSSIPLDRYPTLQHIRYDFINGTVSGNCTVPASPGSTGTNSTACMAGTFNPGDWLPFNLTSNVPLNNSVTPVATTNSTLRTVDKQWSFNNAAPSLILKRVDSSTGSLVEEVLRTAIVKPGDCTRLKVCLNGVSNHPGGVVGAEVMAPLGLIMIRQADNAILCTTPSDDDNLVYT